MDDDPLRYSLRHGSWPAGTADAAERLEEVSIPDDWGRDRVRAVLKDAGEKISNDLLNAAIRYRKELADRAALGEF